VQLRDGKKKSLAALFAQQRDTASLRLSLTFSSSPPPSSPPDTRLSCWSEAATGSCNDPVPDLLGGSRARRRCTPPPPHSQTTELQLCWLTKVTGLYDGQRFAGYTAGDARLEASGLLVRSKHRQAGFFPPSSSCRLVPSFARLELLAVLCNLPANFVSPFVPTRGRQISCVSPRTEPCNFSAPRCHQILDPGLQSGFGIRRLACPQRKTTFTPATESAAQLANTALEP
jgi:hypothetical protein